MLCGIRPDQAEVQQEVRKKTEKEENDLEGMEGKRQGAGKKEQQGKCELKDKDGGVGEKKNMALLFREHRPKWQIAEVYGRQKREEKQRGREDDHEIAFGHGKSSIGMVLCCLVLWYYTISGLVRQIFHGMHKDAAEEKKGAGRMRIAIVDDEAEVRETTRQHLAKIFGKYWPEETAVVQIDLFDSAESLLACFGRQLYDLVLLDILMPGLGGMEAARRLRAASADVGIIFLTSSEAYLMEGYRVFADGYFLKPMGADEEAFQASLQRVFARRAKARRALSVRYNGRALDLPFKKICYADIEGGRLRIVLEGQDFRFTRPFTYEWAAERLLTDKRFQECYHRILVNMDMIESMEAEDFVLTNGTRLPISQRRRSAVRTAYMQYLLNK